MFIPPIIIYYMKKANCYPKGRGVGLALDLSKYIFDINLRFIWILFILWFISWYWNFPIISKS